MKYSVRGDIQTADATTIISTINNYQLWRLVTDQGDDSFSFEAWVNSATDKDLLFNDLKTYVNYYSGEIDWHKCTHDEPEPQPCVMSEDYRG